MKSTLPPNGRCSCGIACQGRAQVSSMGMHRFCFIRSGSACHELQPNPCGQSPDADPQIVSLSQVTLTERPTPAARALQETLDTFHATSDASTSYSDAAQQAYKSVGLLRQLDMRQRRYAKETNAGCHR